MPAPAPQKMENEAGRLSWGRIRGFPAITEQGRR